MVSLRASVGALCALAGAISIVQDAKLDAALTEGSRPSHSRLRKQGILAPATQGHSLNFPIQHYGQVAEDDMSEFGVARFMIDSSGSSMEAQDPVTGAMIGMKVFCMTVNLAITLAMARVAASIEAAGEQLKEVSAEMDKQLEAIQKLIDDPTKEATTRLADVSQEIAAQIIKLMPADRITKFAADKLGGKYTTAKEARTKVLVTLRQEFDSLLNLDQPEETEEDANEVDARKAEHKPKYKLLNDVAPTLAQMTEIIAPAMASPAALERKVGKAIASSGSKALAAGKTPENPIEKAMDEKYNELLRLTRTLAKERAKVKNKSVTASGKADVANAGAGADASLQTAEDIKAKMEEQMDSLAEGVQLGVTGAAIPDEMSDFAGTKQFELMSGFMEAGGGPAIPEDMVGAAGLAAAVVGVAKTLNSALEAYKMAKTGEYQAWRRVGVARETAVNMKIEATYSTCRLLIILYNQLTYFSSLKAEEIAQMPFEQLLASPALTAGLPQDGIHGLRLAIHAKLCGVFLPVRVRIGALFRFQGRCTMLTQFSAASTAVATGGAKKVSFITDEGSSPSIANCDPQDIYDVKLVRIADAPSQEGMGWTRLKSAAWPDGELNAELSVNAVRGWFGSGKAGHAQKPELSRVLLFRRCKDIKDMKTGKLLFDLNKQPGLVQPVTDFKIVVRTGDPKSVSQAEKDLVEAGYVMVLFDECKDPSKPVSGTGVNKRVISSYFKEINNAFNWWDNAGEYKYPHTDVNDLNTGMSEKRPPLFLYIRRGNGPTPVVDIDILPFHNNKVDDADKTVMMQEMAKKFRETYIATKAAAIRQKGNSKFAQLGMHADADVVAGMELDAETAAGIRDTLAIANMETMMSEVDLPSKPEEVLVGAQYEIGLSDVSVPAGCKALMRRRLSEVKIRGWTGLKGAIVNFFKYRSIQKKKDISEDIIQLGFYVDCSANEEHSPYRWMRLAVSPYEGSWDDGILRMLYIWQRKRFQPVLLPDTSKGEKGCPNACAMAAEGNKFITTGQGGSKAIVKAVTEKM